MLQSIEEVGIEKGLEKGLIIGREEERIIGREEGRKEAAEKIALKLLRLNSLNKEQISEVTGLDRKKLIKLENRLKSA